MSSMYPSLEDMKVDQLMQTQQNMARQAAAAVHQHAGHPSAPHAGGPPDSASVKQAVSTLYPSLSEYMGLNLTEDIIQANMPNALHPYPQVGGEGNAGGAGGQVAVPSGGRMVAPVTSQGIVGFKRAEVTHGVRQVVVCKDGNGRIGMRVRSINKGVFVSLVTKDSPAALAGLRFGDQILQVNGADCAGWDTDKGMDVLKKAPKERIELAVRDRPFERTITLHKDSQGSVGFIFEKGKINAIVKDSSAARNGLLTEHNLLEVNGQNVIAMKDKEIVRILDGAGSTVTLTIMPHFLFEHMMKCMNTGLVKKAMDHSIPDL